MTGESLYPRDLIERLRAELDRHEAGVRPLLTASQCRQCGGQSRDDLEGELRTIQAHRVMVDWAQSRLPYAEPILRALASIYFPESATT